MPLPTHTISVCRLLIATLAMLAATFSHAVPDTITYQGYLTNALGVPVSGPVNMSVRIYDEAGSALLYEETQSNVAVTVGLFQIAIGAGSPVSGTFGPALFQGPMAAGEFELQINGETLSPRRPIRSTPYAQAAGDANSLSGTPAYRFLQLDRDDDQSFASGQLVINGQTGIRTAGNYRYMSPRTFTYYISPGRFVADEAPDRWVLFGGGLFRWANTTSLVRSSADFNLPDGAVMTKLTCYYYDPNLIGAITTLTAWIYTRSGIYIDSRATLDTDSVIPSTSNNMRAQSVTPQFQPVDSSLPLFMTLSWQTSNISSTLRFYGCAVEYTVTSLSD